MSVALADSEATQPAKVAEPTRGGETWKWQPNVRTSQRAAALGVDLRAWPIDEPEPGWQDRAACKAVDSVIADAMTECLSQVAASGLVSQYCARCPVVGECFATGRATKGHGLWGIVLRDGRIATWRTATERSRKMPAETTKAEPPNRRRGQRVQPRRLTRARRRSRRAASS